jgi:hypothetical protein
MKKSELNAHRLLDGELFRMNKCLQRF